MANFFELFFGGLVKKCICDDIRRILSRDEAPVMQGQPSEIVQHDQNILPMPYYRLAHPRLH